MLIIIAIISEEQLLVFTTYFIILGIGMQQKKKSMIPAFDKQMKQTFKQFITNLL